MGTMGEEISLVQAALKQLLVLTALLGMCIAKEMPAANFVFGDSLVDVGNNNYISTLSRANYLPNGIDFGGPTGRFTNGRTIADIIGQELGFEGFTPPYLAPSTTGEAILKGVNYASGAGGILNLTGFDLVGRMNMDAQLDNFANTREEIIASMGSPAAMELLQNSIYSVTMGANDLINNYLVPVVSKVEQKLISPEAFLGSLITRYRTQLTRLYKMGGRKIIVVNIGPVGCIPYERDFNPSAGDNCVEFPNQLAQSFNTLLKGLVAELNTNLQDSKFLYANVYDIVMDLIQNYASYGFENANSACCHLAGRHGGLIPCGGPAKVCADRSKYIFWDAYHPSEAANMIIAKRLMDGGTNDISPINIRQLFPSS